MKRFTRGWLRAGYNMKKKGGVLITVRDSDKSEITDTAKRYVELGFTLYATSGTAKVIRDAGMEVEVVNKIHEAADNTMTLLESGKVDYIISTSSKGRIPTRDSVKIRRKAVERAIPCITSIDTANALAGSLRGRYSQYNTELVDINHMRSEKMKLNFTKMHGAGNDYIYFNCFEKEISSPESLSVHLSDRHLGIGGDGIIMICPSNVADAKMRIFNLDGSEGKMCGNGIRCVGKYLYDNRMVDKNEITVETLSGIKKLKLYIRGGKVQSVCVDMGSAVLTPKMIPVTLKGEKIVDEPIVIDGKTIQDHLRVHGKPALCCFLGQTWIF